MSQSQILTDLKFHSFIYPNDENFGGSSSIILQNRDDNSVFSGSQKLNVRAGEKHLKV